MKTAGRLLFGLFLVLGLPLLSFGQDCFPNGDMNGSGDLSPADYVAILNCVTQGIMPCPPLPTGDLNCDGYRDVADIVLEAECVFLSAAPLGPCPIADVRPLGPPAPGDVIIVEPRIIFPPGGGAPYTSLTVSILNADMLKGIAIPLGEIQTEPPTYAVLSPDGSDVTSLDPFWTADVVQTFYAGAAPGPDPFLLWGINNAFGGELPNAVPKPLYEINFDLVLPPCGTVLFDSLPPAPPAGAFLENTIEFVTALGERVPVNFVMGKLAVKGDIDFSGGLTPADVVALLNCVFLGIGACPLCPGDINSSGGFEAVDAVLLLGGVFLGTFTP